jgi:hypothetical protein
MDNRFKVGDKVKISNASEYYGIGKNNPKDIDGVITSISEGGGLSHYVAWSNGGTNSYNASDLIKVEEVEEVKEKSIHDILVERSTLEVGDIVKVTHKVPSDDLGWSNCWCSGMDRAIGKECEVMEAPDFKGVILGGLGEGYSYPLQSVQFVRKGLKSITIPLTKDHNVVVSKEGIKVGCQTITFKAFDELASAVAKMRK